MKERDEERTECALPDTRVGSLPESSSEIVFADKAPVRTDGARTRDLLKNMYDTLHRQKKAKPSMSFHGEKCFLQSHSESLRSRPADKMVDVVATFLFRLKYVPLFFQVLNAGRKAEDRRDLMNTFIAGDASSVMTPRTGAL